MECTRFAGWTSSLTAEEIRQVLATRASAPTYKDTGSQYKPTAKKAKSTAWPVRQEKTRVLQKFEKKTSAEQAAARRRAGATDEAGGPTRQGTEPNRRSRAAAVRRAGAQQRPEQMVREIAFLEQLRSLDDRLEYMQKPKDR